MDTRTIQSVISEMLVEVERLSQLPEQIATAKDQIDLFLLREIESRIAFGVLLDLLRATLKKTPLVQSEILADFHRIYDIRWRLIKRTDCAYNIAPALPVNRAWLLVAQNLAPFEGKHAFDWMMPTVHFQEAITLGQKTCYEYQLHEFLISSKEVPLILDSCFEYLEAKASLPKRRRSNKAGHPAQHEEMQSTLKSLSMVDEVMVSEHSVLAKEYYNAIKLRENTQLIKDKFKQSLKTGQVEVLASYNETGRETLMASLLDNANTLLRMTDFLYKLVPKLYWKYFLTNLSPDKLFNIVLRLDLNILREEARRINKDFGSLLCLKTNEILRQLCDAKFVFKHEDELRALMYCLLQVYRNSRNEGPEFNSSLGYFGSFFSLAHSKEERLQSCDVLGNFLLCNPPHPLNDFVGYLKKNHFNEFIAPLTVGAYIEYNNTTLYKLSKLMMDTAEQFSNIPDVRDQRVCRK